MNVKSLIPWGRGRDVSVRRGDDISPFFSLQREMNRLFDDAFRSFDLAPFGTERGFGWPSVEMSETDSEICVTAELPGLSEKDVQVEYADGVLTISGEKKAETEDRERLVSERYYGRFERRIAVDGIDQDKIGASFKNGVLTVTMPKAETAKRQVRRIAINGK
jgi:HSP20 family protein